MIEEIVIFFQIVFIDLVLAGDNAIIIGMVASQFKNEIRKKIIFWGIAFAIILRIIFTLLTAYLLQINGIKTILSVSGNSNWQEGKDIIASSWFNVLRKEEFMDIHSHGYHKNSFYGFHVIINAITPAFTSYYHPIKFTNGAFYIPNIIGTLTLFPNYIPHDVTANKYETPRISIAGDIFLSTWLDEVSNGANSEKSHYTKLVLK